VQFAPPFGVLEGRFKLLFAVMVSGVRSGGKIPETCQHRLFCLQNSASRSVFHDRGELVDIALNIIQSPVEIARAYSAAY